ncbi:MAG: hypothetical protein AAGU75_09120 [Bacillota bacterium]
MKKLLTITVAVLLVFAMALPTFALESQDGTKLSGQHDTLNIIGVQNPKTADMTNSNGNVIFVPISGQTKIMLEEATDGEFAVLDANGTDGTARFKLPAPGYDPYLVGTEDTVMSDYSIFVRPLGKPGGFSTITTCAELVDQDALISYLSKDFVRILNHTDGAAYVSIEQVGQDITLREKGKTSFTNVTAQLTSVVFAVAVDTNGDGLADMTEFVRVPIFDDMLANEYWQYDNSGLKLLQVRFYPFGTNVADADDPAAWDEAWGQ